MYTEIKTFEDACTKLSIVVPEFITSEDANGDGKAVVAFQKLIIIARALNDGWVPDWSDYSQWKYWPWFNHNDTSAVGGFSYCDCEHDSSYSYVGSRLCYSSSEIAKYAGTQFLDLYRDFQTLQQQ